MRFVVPPFRFLCISGILFGLALALSLDWSADLAVTKGINYGEIDYVNNWTYRYGEICVYVWALSDLVGLI